MSQIISNDQAESCLRECLLKEGYDLTPKLKNGQTGPDIIATKGNELLYIEVIGFKKSPPARSRDFYEVFFRAISRLEKFENGTNKTEKIIIALPERFKNGLHQRAAHYGIAWEKLGDTFPELEIWLINCDSTPDYKRSNWNDWLA